MPRCFYDAGVRMHARRPTLCTKLQPVLGFRTRILGLTRHGMRRCRDISAGLTVHYHYPGYRARSSED